MMKFFSRNIYILAAVGILLVACPAAMAQTDVGFDLCGGLSVPIGDLNDTHNLGFGTQGSFYFAFSPVAAAGLGVGYSWFKFDDSEVPTGIEVSGGNFSTLSVCPELRFMVGAVNMPTFTAIVGAGLYHLMQSDLDIANSITPEESETVEFNSVNKFGMNIAGRVVFPMGPTMKFGFQAMNHLVFTEDDSISFFEFMAVINITTGP
jgi:hypothetical protein